MARAILPKNNEVIQETEAFIQGLNDLPKDINMQSHPEIQKAFKYMTQRYRELGSRVREDYVGFIGNIK